MTLRIQSYTLLTISRIFLMNVEIMRQVQQLWNYNIDWKNYWMKESHCFYTLRLIELIKKKTEKWKNYTNCLMYKLIDNWEVLTFYAQWHHRFFLQELLVQQP